jgi:hypothetical protein
MRPALRIVLSACCLAAAAALLLLATDVLRWKAAMQAGDVRFRVAPADAELWKPTQLVPFGVARGLLGLGDDVAYRSSVRTFRRGRVRELAFDERGLIAVRREAHDQLIRAARSDPEPVRRSAAYNLVGVLALADASLDPSRGPAFLADAIGSFQQAISLDPESDDAKYNLELALARLPAATKSAGGGNSGTTRGGRGKAAGTGQPGSGY